MQSAIHSSDKVKKHVATLAMVPQSGAITAATKKVIEKTTPDQMATFSVATPRSNKYMGKKGISIV